MANTRDNEPEGDIRSQRILELWRSGKSLSEISMVMGETVADVARCLKECQKEILAQVSEEETETFG